MIRIEIPSVPPSINELTGRGAHWTKRRQLVAGWHDSFAFFNPQLSRHKSVPAIVTLTFYCRGDADNRCKPALDSLVRAGYLTDDRYPWLYELRLRSRPAKQPLNLRAGRDPKTLARSVSFPYHTIIEIEDYEDPFTLDLIRRATGKRLPRSR